MRRMLGISRWVASGGVLLALGGCFTSQQLLDFTRTEFARQVSDLIGRVFQIYVQASV